MDKIGIISTFPPTQCGIATYASDLIENFKSISMEFSITEFELTHSQEKKDTIKFITRNNEIKDYYDLCDYINFSDIDLIDIQHEFKIFGKPDGENINILLDKIQRPIVTTLHTVNQSLPAKREQTFMNILNRSDLLYLFSKESSEYIQSKYKIQPTKIVVIPHGVPKIEFKLPHENLKRNQYSNEIVFTSTGHMRDSKGYDIAIRALNILRQENIDFHYYIIGSNHPENESAKTYRNELLELIDKFSMRENVTFINDYLPLKDLIDFIQLADVCLLPYSRKEQSSSGVLSLMIACGRPIVSTPFQFATSQMTDSSGIISETFLPFDYAKAIKALIKERHSWEKIMLYNYTIGTSWSWTQVAKLYSSGYNRILKKKNDCALS